VSPGEEMRAAAFQLRNPFHGRGLRVPVDTDLGERLADWLEHTASLVDAVPFPATHPYAAAVARVINEPENT